MGEVDGEFLVEEVGKHKFRFCLAKQERVGTWIVPWSSPTRIIFTLVIFLPISPLFKEDHGGGIFSTSIA